VGGRIGTWTDTAHQNTEDPLKNPLIEKIKKICKDEDIILLFDSDEVMDWGIPEVHKDGIFLSSENGDTRDGVKEWFYKWKDISLVAHYGFKVDEIKANFRDEVDYDENSRRKIWELSCKNGTLKEKKDTRKFMCVIGLHDTETDRTRKEKHYESGSISYPKICKYCKEKSSYLYKPGHFGDPLEIYGNFSLLGNGLYVRQAWGAEAVIMPHTEIIDIKLDSQ